MFFSKINCLYLFVILFFLSRNHANLFGLDARPGATSAIERSIMQAQRNLGAALQEIRLALGDGDALACKFGDHGEEDGCEAQHCTARDQKILVPVSYGGKPCLSGPSDLRLGMQAGDGMCWYFTGRTLDEDLKNSSQHKGFERAVVDSACIDPLAGCLNLGNATAHSQGDFFRQIFGPDDSEIAQTGSFLKVLIGELEQAGLPKEDLIKAREDQRRLEKKIIKEGQKAFEICNSFGRTIKGLSDKVDADLKKADADLKSKYFKERRDEGALQRQKNIAALGRAPMPSGAGGGSSGKATKRSRSDDVLDGRKSKEATV